MAVTFILHDSKSKNETPLFMMFRYGLQRIKITTGMKIMPKDWNKNELKARRSKEGYSSFNNELQKMESAANNAFLTFKNIANREPTPNELRDAINKTLVKKNLRRESSRTEKSDLYSFIEQFIKKAPTRIANKKTGKTVTRATIQIYQRTFEILKSYKKDLSFKQINISFYNDFVKFLFSERTEMEKRRGVVKKVTRKPMTANACGKIVKTLKTFMREAYENGLHDNLDFTKKGFTVMSEQTTAIAFTEEELFEIETLDLSSNKKIEKVRDICVFHCRCPLRVSDLLSLNSENIIGEDLHVTTQKTDESVIIPIDPKMKEIIEKYKDKEDGSLLPKISDVKYNKYLKELAQLIPSMHNTIITECTRGGKKERNSVFKWTMVQTHTMRRTGATHLYKMGVPIIDIMALTGHKDIDVFKTYIRISKQESADRIRKLKEEREKTLV